MNANERYKYVLHLAWQAQLEAARAKTAHVKVPKSAARRLPKVAPAAPPPKRPA